MGPDGGRGALAVRPGAPAGGEVRAAPAEEPDPAFASLRRSFLHLTGIDLNFYRGKQLDRRLRSFLQLRGMADLGDLAERLAGEPGLLQALKDYLTINVSEFFRNPEKFEELRELVLPELLAGGGSLKAWSAGCASGAEPYTLAIILDRLSPGGRHDILATDIDRLSLERSRQGLYTADEVRSVPPDVLARYFARRDEGWEVSPAIRRAVRFTSHNLLADPYPQGLDLILCRNVVIYFTDEARDHVYRNFSRSLRPGGYLFIGGTETIFRSREYGLVPVRPCFYKREA